MPGLEEPSGARLCARCCTPLLCPLQGCQALMHFDARGTPQLCDQHQACNAVSWTISGFSSLSCGQRWSQHVLVLLGHNIDGTGIEQGLLLPSSIKKRPKLPMSFPLTWTPLRWAQMGNTVTSTRYLRKSKTSRQTLPLVRSFVFWAGWCEILSCDSS